MTEAETNAAFAALDIGTSQVKLGVYCAAISDQIIQLGNLPNELIQGAEGEVLADYQVIRERSFRLLHSLGVFLRQHNVGKVCLGICGHVSSLAAWNRQTGAPPQHPFPVWLDTSSRGSLEEYKTVMGEGKSRHIIGTFLPAGTNWLFTKLLHQKKSGFPGNSIFLQAGDGIFHELCGRFRTHFSSQISMVNLHRRAYAPELLQHLGLDASSLPPISDAPCHMLQSHGVMFGLPAQTLVFPAMADLYTSLYGLQLRDREGFMLANTSEQAGIFYENRPEPATNFLHIAFDNGFVNYGSTNTGGNLVNWFIQSILRKTPTARVLNELTAQAATIAPEDTPVILPYLQGERAPLWNSLLTASILELNGSHTDAHLFRAILESVACARRQCFEELGMHAIGLVKLAGGASGNDLWNRIRAAALNKPLAVSDEKELAIAGLMHYLLKLFPSSIIPPANRFPLIQPDTGLAESYNLKYQKFMRYQKLLS